MPDDNPTKIDYETAPARRLRPYNPLEWRVPFWLAVIMAILIPPLLLFGLAVWYSWSMRNF